MRRLGLASALVFLAVLAGCKASSPSKVERGVMRWTKHTVSVRNKSERNPLPPTAENLAAGKGGFFPLLRSLSWNGWSEYRRPFRGEHVASSAVAQFVRGPVLYRRPAEVGNR